MLSQISKRFANIGFIGLGNMGGPMAANLANKGGHDLTVLDVSQERIDWVNAETGGAVTSVATPAEVAANCKTIVTMLPSNPHVLQVYTDRDTDAACTYLDAPVSGGVTAAAAGTLTFMVGNESEEKFSLGKDILQHMGANIVSVTGTGNGQVAKICNNMMLGISMIGVSETMNLGIRLGIDKDQLAGIMNISSGRCWSSDTYNPVPGVIPGVPSNNNWNGGFGAALMLKDLGLAQDAAASVSAQTPLGAQAAQIYRMLVQQGYGGKDFGSVYHFFKTDGKSEI